MTIPQQASWDIIGHDWAVDFLRKSLAHGRARHAYLLVGPQGIGKTRLGHLFAMALNCTEQEPAHRPCGGCRSCRLVFSGNHPDILYPERDEKTGVLRIDAVRETSRLLALKPFDARYRVALFDRFDLARPQAQDALLKTLEEPSPYAVLVLMAPALGALLPTIISRCQTLRLRPLATADVEEALLARGATASQATLLTRLSNGRIGWALAALEDSEVLAERERVLGALIEVLDGNRSRRFALADELAEIGNRDKQALADILETWQTYWRDALLLGLRSPVKPCNSDRLDHLNQLARYTTPAASLHALRATHTFLHETLSTNANLRLSLEVLFLDYPELR